MMKENLNKMTVKELKEIAKEKGVVGYSKFNKTQLIEVLTEIDNVDDVIDEVLDDIDVEEKFYKRRSTTKRMYYKNWGGKERVRYACGHCGCKIGNPTDHFCYNCGWKFDGTDTNF